MEINNFEIAISTQKDLSIISELFETEKFEAEFLIRKDDSAFLICFESEYGEYELINDIENIFDNYKRIEKISIGNYQIKIHILRHKAIIDDWRGALTSNIEENIYFIANKA